jgi:hypothetical protein
MPFHRHQFRLKTSRTRFAAKVSQSRIVTLLGAVHVQCQQRVKCPQAEPILDVEGAYAVPIDNWVSARGRLSLAKRTVAGSVAALRG